MARLGQPLSVLSAGTSLAGVFLFCLFRRRRFARLVAVLFAVSLIGGLSGCGGGGTSMSPASMGPTSMALTSSNSKVAAGANLMLQASIVSRNPLQGTVVFYDGTTALGNAITPVNGVASLSTSALSVGIHTITAKYSGDSENGSSVSSDTLQQAITGTFTVVVSATSGSLNHTVNVSATLQ
jgi:hypothetical protein